MKPEALTKSAVPRSGSIRMSSPGTAIISRARMTLPMPGTATRTVTSQATISGMVSFASSEGWMRAMPMLSQRWAPPALLPSRRTRTRRMSVSQ